MIIDDLLRRELGLGPDDTAEIPEPFHLAPGKVARSARLMPHGDRPRSGLGGTSVEVAVNGAVGRVAGPHRGDDPFALHLVQRRAVGGGLAEDAAAQLSEASGATGAPLPEPLRAKFESSLGTALGNVRVHVGAASAAAAEAIAARAYTVGQEIHFAAGAFDPASAEGEHLLAHEVAHTVQQAGLAARPQAKLEISSPGDASEHEADRAADAMVRGTPATVGTVGGHIARTPQPGAGPVLPAGDTPDLSASMFEVTGAKPAYAGTVTAEKDADKIILVSPAVTFTAKVHTTQPVTDRLDVGPIQTMLSSSRVGVYREGGKPDGKIVAEQRTDMGEMRDVTGEMDQQARIGQSTVAPFYSMPVGMIPGMQDAEVVFKDVPKAKFPARVALGTLTETKGEDSFVTSVSAKRGAALVHLKTFHWQLPWGLKLDDGVIQADDKGKTTAQVVTSQPAKPEEGIAHGEGAVPILAAPGATHMDFATQEAANAATPRELLRYLPTAVEPSKGFIINALRAKNPTMHITVTVKKQNSSWGSDSVEVRIRGTAQVTRPRVSAGDGGTVAVMVQMNELFPDLAALKGGSVITIEAQDRSIVDGKSHRTDWGLPFERLQGEMQGKDGTYDVLAVMGPV